MAAKIAKSHNCPTFFQFWRSIEFSVALGLYKECVFQPIFWPNDFASKHRTVQDFSESVSFSSAFGGRHPSTTPSDFFNQILLGTPMDAPRAPRAKVLPALSICKEHLPLPPDPSIWWCLHPNRILGGGGGKAACRVPEVPNPAQSHEPPAWPRPRHGGLVSEARQSSRHWLSRKLRAFRSSF